LRITPYSLSVSVTRPPTQSYPLSLHDALPIFGVQRRKRSLSQRGQLCTDRSQPRVEVEHAEIRRPVGRDAAARIRPRIRRAVERDRKSTRLNSSHGSISYAVFCLKKKKKRRKQ